MLRFALVTEGVTDQAVLENILCGYFGEDEIEVNALQPIRNDSQSFGNWLNVFEYCQSPKLAQSLQLNDYLIIQIDTDVSEEAGYNVPKFYINDDGENTEKTVEQMIDNVQKKLIDKIPSEVYTRYQSRILFAICVDSLECWLLPIVSPEQSSKTKNCLNTFQKHLAQRKKTRLKALDKKIAGIPDKILKNSKNYDLYNELSLYYLEADFLKICSQENSSFSIFILGLEQISVRGEGKG